ncbi:hypothetical protein BDN72DRAFT_152483 [Pluteus cervinus]|uniref:Uncharacterized protein n=1 Tax=Pluteus cervinus TaxID=181527 RepID=A0ACD3B811_9AGAR|nr:hypothetical protein BDN72DRAFT_152483 [Pluteus cervinus]
MTIISTQPLAATVHHRHRLSLDAGIAECWSCLLAEVEPRPTPFPNRLVEHHDGGDYNSIPPGLSYKGGSRLGEAGSQAPLFSMASDSSSPCMDAIVKPSPPSNGVKLYSEGQSTPNSLEPPTHSHSFRNHNNSDSSSSSSPPPPQMHFPSSSSRLLKRHLSKKKSMVGLRRQFILDEEAALRVLDRELEL